MSGCIPYPWPHWSQDPWYREGFELTPLSYSKEEFSEREEAFFRLLKKGWLLYKSKDSIWIKKGKQTKRFPKNIWFCFNSLGLLIELKRTKEYVCYKLKEHYRRGLMRRRIYLDENLI